MIVYPLMLGGIVEVPAEKKLTALLKTFWILFFRVMPSNLCLPIDLLWTLYAFFFKSCLINMDFFQIIVGIEMSAAIGVVFVSMSTCRNRCR